MSYFGAIRTRVGNEWAVVTDDGYLVVGRDAFAQMTEPVQCVCGQVYDLGSVTVVQRFIDCSVWKAPCCGRVADDRPGGAWGGVEDYIHLRRGRD